MPHTLHLPEERQVIPTQPLSRPSEEVVSPSAPDFVPRHWHEPHDLKASGTKPKASDTRQVKKRSPASTSNQVADARDCRTDKLDPLLRKLNLSPQCNP